MMKHFPTMPSSIALITIASPSSPGAPATMITAGVPWPMSVAALLAATMWLVAPSGATELQLLSQGLPPSSYTTDGKPGKDSGTEKAFDGRWTGPATSWCNGPRYPTWLMVDLGADYTLIKTMAYMEKPGVWYGYTISVSSDKQHWTIFADQSANTDPSEDPAYTDMGLTVGRYVKITLVDVAERSKSWFCPVIEEFQVYGVAVETSSERKHETTPQTRQR